MSNYLEDTESDVSSQQSDVSSVYDNNHGFEDSESSPSNTGKAQTITSNFRKAENDNNGVGNWIEEFRADMEWEKLSISVHPVTLLFSDLSLTRYDEVKKQKEIVFYQVSGYAEAGTMVALLGGSKESITTLLKCLAGRVPLNGDLTGELQVDGSKPSTTFYRAVGNVERLDAHQPYLSVRESLQFSAALRLNRKKFSTMSLHIHVKLVLRQLGLQHYANQLVGSLRDATGKTFEIVKKLTIAVELAANPSMLFLEEPISGLDAAGTLQILTVLSQLSASDQIVIAILNHPNTRALSYFHQALILTQEGQQPYFGPVGFNCKELLGYFTAIPRVPQYYLVQSPASFIIGILGLGINVKGSALTDFAKEYRESSLYEFNRNVIISMKKLRHEEEIRKCSV